MPKPSSTVDTQITPDPALEKRTRRKFSTEYKLKIIQLSGGGTHGLKHRLGAVGAIDALKEQAVQRDVEISRRAETLDEGDGTGLCLAAFQTRLFDQNTRNGAIAYLLTRPVRPARAAAAERRTGRAAEWERKGAMGAPGPEG